MNSENWPLLGRTSSCGQRTERPEGLSLLFTTLCIVDLFGVFPVMALPRPIIDCGWMGLPLALLVFSIQVYTAILLGRCWVIAELIEPDIVSKNRYPYSALVEMSLGANTSKFVTLLLDVAVFGGGVPNLLVASQNLQLLGLKISTFTVDISYCYWLITLGVVLCPIMWLGSPKDLKWVAVVSVGAAVGVALLTWTCMLIDTTETDPVSLPYPSWESFAIAYGILAFQFDIHPMILTVQVDMKNKADLSFAIMWSFLVTGGLFTVSTAIAMLKYGTSIRYNVLQGLPTSGLLYLDLLLVTVQICLSMVVGASALFQDIEDRFGVPREFNWKRCATRSALMIFTVVIGEVVPRFDLIMGLIGGALTGPLMFIFPPLLYMRYRQLASRHSTSLGCIKDESCRQQRAPPENNLHYNISFSSTNTASSDDTSICSRMSCDGIQYCLSNECGSCVANEGSVSTNCNVESYQDNRHRCLFSLTLKNSTQNNTLTEINLATEPMTVFETVFILSVVLLGLIATCSATFYSVRGAIRYAQFTPACFP